MAILGLGATFSLHNGTALTAFASITSVKPPTPKGSAVETTDHSVTSSKTRTFIAGLKETSDIVVKGYCMVGDATYNLAIGQIGVVRAFKVVIPGDSGGTNDALDYTGNCIPLEMDVGDAVPGEVVEFTFTAKPTGAVTETAS